MDPGKALGWLPERRIGLLNAPATLGAGNGCRGRAIGTARPVWAVGGLGRKADAVLWCKTCFAKSGAACLRLAVVGTLRIARCEGWPGCVSCVMLAVVRGT